MKNRLADELMSSSDIKGVLGTKVIEGSGEGQNVGILLSTHGNERAPFTVLPIVLDLIRNQLRGNLMLVMVNPEAYKINQRFVEFDMNRVYKKNGPDGNTLEDIRARELLPVFSELYVALDLHTVPINPGARAFTVIPGKTDLQKKLAQQLDVQYNVLYPSYINDTGSTSDAFVAEGKACMTLELGEEGKVDISAQVFNILRYLMYTESISEITLPKKVEKNTWLEVSQMEFVGDPQTIAYDEGFIRKSFEPVYKDQVIARDTKGIYQADEEGILLFSRPFDRYKDGSDALTEPFVYLAKEVQ
ncbi:MAG: succinylglutamate desuccinylase/aspartoacylase family protein [Candidatus Gracilibacteria bacterium]|nr:succinylglutamate desuccinylase/aspartoacylase family protein [Candidatus Gracilibacteria bacterium]